MKGAVLPPVVGQYFASTMVIVGMSVVATVIVLQFHHHDPNNGQMPRWVSFFCHVVMDSGCHGWNFAR